MVLTSSLVHSFTGIVIFLSPRIIIIRGVCIYDVFRRGICSKWALLQGGSSFFWGGRGGRFKVMNTVVDGQDTLTVLNWRLLLRGCPAIWLIHPSTGLLT